MSFPSSFWPSRWRGAGLSLVSLAPWMSCIRESAFNPVVPRPGWLTQNLQGQALALCLFNKLHGDAMRCRSLALIQELAFRNSGCRPACLFYRERWIIWSWWSLPDLTFLIGNSFSLISKLMDPNVVTCIKDICILFSKNMSFRKLIYGRKYFQFLNLKNVYSKPHFYNITSEILILRILQ